MAEQKTGNMVFSIVEGGEFVATFPHPLTLETVEELEQQLAIFVRGLRRTALQQQNQADGEAEYASWFPLTAGVGEVGVVRDLDDAIDRVFGAAGVSVVDHQTISEQTPAKGNPTS